MMNLFALSGLLVGISTFFFGCFVYFKNPKRFLNKIWCLFNFSASIWGFGGLAIGLTKDPARALFLWRLAHLGVIFIPITFYHFVITFLELNEKKRKTIRSIYIIGFLFLLFNITGHLIKHVAWVFNSFYFTSSVSMLYVIFFTLWSILVICGHWELFKGFLRSSGLKRNQIKYFFLATCTGFLGGITCFLPAFGIIAYPYGNLTVPFYPCIMSYAIVRYRLMDIRLVITRAGLFLILYTAILGFPFYVGHRTGSWIISTSIAVFLATSGPIIYRFLQKKAENLLLAQQYRYQEILKKAAGEMARIHNLKQLLSFLVNIFTKDVNISSASIYLLNEESNTYSLEASRNIEKENVLSINKNDPLIMILNNRKSVLVYEEIKREVQENPAYELKEIEKKMRTLNSAVIIPCFLDEKLLSIFVLGEKRSKTIYTIEDLNIFSVLASQAALAIDNALLYDNIENQVQQRTHELLVVQKQLIQAEKLATMGTLAGGVAHEINNPLTAILTNVQMLLASDELTNDKESLELIEEATKRCRTIVQKLMTYAKKPLESGKMNKVDLLKVVTNVVSFLGYQLEQDNIKMVTDIKEDSYWIIGNHNELEQLVTNLILNAKDAIKQVKKGGTIYIALEKGNNNIDLKIEDDGIGMTQETISKIFDPFFTTKDVGKGVGLGLSICQSIIEKHGGEIVVKSNLHKGARFIISLPNIKNTQLAPDQFKSD